MDMQIETSQPYTRIIPSAYSFKVFMRRMEVNSPPDFEAHAGASSPDEERERLRDLWFWHNSQGGWGELNGGAQSEGAD